MKITIEVDGESLARAKAWCRAACIRAIKWGAVIAAGSAAIALVVHLQAEKRREARYRAAEAMAREMERDRAAGLVSDDPIAYWWPRAEEPAPSVSGGLVPHPPTMTPEEFSRALGGHVQGQLEQAEARGDAEERDAPQETIPTP